MRQTEPVNNEVTFSDDGQGRSQGQTLLGAVVSVSEAGAPRVSFEGVGKDAGVEALTTVPLDASCIGRQVLLTFPGNHTAPVVIGLVRSLLDDVLAEPSVKRGFEREERQVSPGGLAASGVDRPEVLIDGKKLELAAPEEITLRCGKSSITLRQDGKIVVRGEHILSRARGAHRIKGGSIELN
ncbi:MAG: hypothetical protein CSB48_03555 [Proteobacteria bacterium]|nr:MAG: hypothetical protein CSB48_03555 [Pseudomonadota bacterium]